MNAQSHPTPHFAGAVFVGREREVAQLRAGLEETADGHGRLFLIVGEAGIGKTRLVEELAADAERCRHEVLWGRCWEGEGAPPYWPWVQIIRAHVKTSAPQGLTAETEPSAPYLVQLVPELRERFPPRSAPPTSPESEHARFYLFDALTNFWKRAAARTPLALIFDDLQWADTPSLLLLRFLAHEMRDARILVVGTYREMEMRQSPAVTEILGALAREGHHVPLRGLSEEEVRRFIETTAGRAASPGLVRTVHQQTEGNPFFVDEVVRMLIADGGLDHPGLMTARGLPIPQGVRAVIRRRLASLPASCNDLLTVASVIGREFDLACLQPACEVKLEQLLEGLSAAVAGGIIVRDQRGVGRYRFSHVLIRETLYEALTLLERRRLHQRIGAVLEVLYQAHAASAGQAPATDSGQVLAELAHHFLQVAPGSEAEKGVAYATRAARHATASLAYEEAAVLYTRALQVLDLCGTADETWRCTLLLALGEVQWRQGDRPGARETFQEAAGLARRVQDPTLLARSALGFAGEGSRLLWVQRGIVNQPLITFLEEALAAVGERDSALRARLLARLAVDLFFSPSPERSLGLSAQAVALARQVGNPRVLATALCARCVALWRPERMEERLDVATELVRLAGEMGDQELALVGHRFRLLGSLEQGDVSAADHEIGAWARIAGALRQPLYLTHLAMWRALRALLAGRFTEGEEQATLALTLSRQTRELDGSQQLVTLLGVVRVHQGQLEELTQAVKTFAEHSPESPIWRCYLAYLYCEQNRLSEAQHEVAGLASNDLAVLPRDAHWLLALSLLSAVCSALNDRGNAAILYDLLLPYAGRVAVVTALSCWGAIAHYLGQLAIVLGRVEEGARHFADALRMHEHMGARPLVAWTEYEYARALLAHGGAQDYVQAGERLERALATAQQLGMDGLVAKILSLHPEAAPRRSYLPHQENNPAPEVAPKNLPAAVLPAEPPPGSRVFRRDGDFWTIIYQGQVLHLRETKGLLSIAHLLRHPEREFHAIDLAATVEGMGSEVTYPLTDAGPILDARARHAYQVRWRELREESAAAEGQHDLGRAAKARQELEALTHELTSALGLGGRARSTLSPSERARVNLTKTILAALRKITQKNPALGHYLKSTIRTGTFFSYTPDPEAPVAWQF